MLDAAFGRVFLVMGRFGKRSGGGLRVDLQGATFC